MADSQRSGNCLLKNLDDVKAVIKECEGKFIAVLTYFYTRLGNFCAFSCNYNTFFAKTAFVVICGLKAGVHLKAVLTWLNTAFLPISRSRFNQR